MPFNLYINEKSFIVTNFGNVKASAMEKVNKDIFHIFGYCFVENKVLKNSKVSRGNYEYLAKHQSKISGIFSAISSVDGKIEIVVDPLVQYNLFYYIENDIITISNSLMLIAKMHDLSESEDRHLFDSIAYKSPLRGLTAFKKIYAVQYDDIINNVGVDSYKVPLPLCLGNLSFKIPDTNIYSELSYNELLYLYISRLNQRAEVLADNFNEIHIQLTGGADSRLVLSSLINYDNISCYVYGDGKSQNRLYYENLCNSLKINKCEDILFAGKNLGNSSLIFRGLYDSNFRKFNNLNTYMNSEQFLFEDKCKVTGYYGANVCGGIGFPPEDITVHNRTSFIPSEHFTYHSYVDFFKCKYKDYRGAALKDIFYLNNRGPSHYSAHSIADNLKCNSFDILYDVINLELVKKCPYKNSDIDGNAITIDLIYLNNPLLALFPYDERQIPRYREFKNIPLINCFDGLTFASLELPRIKTTRPNVNVESFDILQKGNEDASVTSILHYEEFKEFFDKYPFLDCLKNDNTISSNVILYYLLSGVLLCNLVKEENN